MAANASDGGLDDEPLLTGDYAFHPRSRLAAAAALDTTLQPMSSRADPAAT